MTKSHFLFVIVYSNVYKKNFLTRLASESTSYVYYLFILPTRTHPDYHLISSDNRTTRLHSSLSLPPFYSCTYLFLCPFQTNKQYRMSRRTKKIRRRSTKAYFFSEIDALGKANTRRDTRDLRLFIYLCTPRHAQRERETETAEKELHRQAEGKNTHVLIFLDG